ncbi:alpha/beta hydrolase [Streptacidiphilus griseoplanus]|uniref:alpha/beta hydrolase n=1 Tax=Peterkaempfera griseoplana TaxID=66896 RepID=UPI000A7826CA|nr:alpha/beta hydrolase [Peterkaempfera griseoplana]BCN13443.1 alpha/beta hydrolase [Peterkaempfera griseoplana]
MTIIVPPGMDPDLVRAATLQPDLDYVDPPAVRASLKRAFKLSRALRPKQAGPQDLTVGERLIPAREGAPDIPVRVYDPVGRAASSPALVFFHGGAFVAGDLETEDARCAEIARRTGVLVVSVDYRLAPEHPFPHGFHDCYDALVWTAEHAGELGVDPRRIAVGGSSAGGALAAAVSLAARDLGGPEIMLQMLLYPVIDDALDTVSMREFGTTPGWNQPNSVHMWNHYLGADDREPVSPYAAPARAEDLTGLPPAYVLTAEFDPLRDEGIQYAVRLLAADVAVELHQFPGTFHGFDAAAPEAVATRRSLDEQCAVLLRAASRTPAAPAGVPV